MNAKREPKNAKQDRLDETDLAQQRMGDNSLEGNDQTSVRNQRHAVPDVKNSTDGVVESLEKLDKDERARRDLNKGRIDSGSSD